MLKFITKVYDEFTRLKLINNACDEFTRLKFITQLCDEFTRLKFITKVCFEVFPSPTMQAIQLRFTETITDKLGRKFVDLNYSFSLFMVFILTLFLFSIASTSTRLSVAGHLCFMLTMIASMIIELSHQMNFWVQMHERRIYCDNK